MQKARKTGCFLKKICYFCRMKEEVSIRLITHTQDLPDLKSKSFFHSVEFFQIVEKTPMQKPCMVIAIDGQGRIVGHLLAIISFHRSLLPPLAYSHCHVYGEGEYAAEGAEKDRIFGMMLKALTERLTRKLCLYIEFSDLSTKMFGYGVFRENGYFPIQWQKVHNSLHSKSPMERLSEKTKTKIRNAEKRGVSSDIAAPGSKDMQDAVKLLKRYFLLKPRRVVPNAKIFDMLAESGKCKVFVTKHNGRVIGTCVCFFFAGNAYMWQLAARRKSFMMYSPAEFTVWSALKHAHEAEYRHFYFLDAGLPFKRNPMREFILNFGGKQVAEYRWFRIQLPLVGKVIDWMYNE